MNALNIRTIHQLFVSPRPIIAVLARNNDSRARQRQYQHSRLRRFDAEGLSQGNGVPCRTTVNHWISANVGKSAGKNVGENVGERKRGQCHQGGPQYCHCRAIGLSIKGHWRCEGAGNREVSIRGRAFSKYCGARRGERYWPEYCCAEQRAHCLEPRKVLAAGFSCRSGHCFMAVAEG